MQRRMRSLTEFQLDLISLVPAPCLLPLATIQLVPQEDARQAAEDF